MPDYGESMIEVPDTITCIDCGQKAHRLTYPPSEEDGGWQPGDIVAYRCRGCNDRWDLVVEDPADSAQPPSASDFR
ncbi:MAG: hypothetical protein HKN23_21280 [Verrucomicrobiales bacterium]|nr:hypothetical protein [Verrucomicrobiales bacterium]